MLSRYSVTFSSSLSVTLHVQSVIAACPQTLYALEHSNLRFESILFDSLCESIRIDSFSKKNRPFDSLVVMQFFVVYLLYSLSQKIS